MESFVMEAQTILEVISKFIRSIPLAYSLPLHCFFVSSLFSFSSTWLFSFWVTYFGAFGGGTVAAYLMGDLPALLKSDLVGPIYAVSWWLMNYTYVGPIYRGFPPLRIVSKAACNMLKSKLIVSHVDKAVDRFPGIIAAPIIFGTLSGCGGKLISDGMKNMAGLIQGSTELTEPTFSFFSAFSSAILHYVLCHVAKLIPPHHGEALVVTILVAHGLVVDATGWYPLDFTYPFRWLLHLVTRVPFTKDNNAVVGAKKQQAVAAGKEELSVSPAASSVAKGGGKKKGPRVGAGSVETKKAK